ncbi:MAG: hypothetical protein KC461_05750, partial [Dehalococcoidia bacterium]|nr:hypothetical protein [Dehalococcoidia bacterium]
MTDRFGVRELYRVADGPAAGSALYLAVLRDWGDRSSSRDRARRRVARAVVQNTGDTRSLILLVPNALERANRGEIEVVMPRLRERGGKSDISTVRALVSTTDPSRFHVELLKDLMEILTGGKPDKRVLLLTATPINNTIWDLYNQLSLITRNNDGWYAGRGPIADLRSTFRAVEKGEGGPGLLDAMMLSLVRRSRHDIRAREAAGESVEVGGQPLRFPRHEFPEAVTYSLQNLYGAIYHEVLDVVQNLNFAVYQLESYGVRTGAEDTEERVKQRNANFVGIMKTILLKRMESSVVALQSTVASMTEYLDLFLSTLDRGQVITPKQAQRIRAVLGGSLPDAEIEATDWDPRAVNALREEHPAPADP